MKVNFMFIINFQRKREPIHIIIQSVKTVQKESLLHGKTTIGKDIEILAINIIPKNQEKQK